MLNSRLKLVAGGINGRGIRRDRGDRRLSQRDCCADHKGNDDPLAKFDPEIVTGTSGTAQIAITIPAALLSTSGTAQIAIQNGPGALSSSFPFVIGNAVPVVPPALPAGTGGHRLFDHFQRERRQDSGHVESHQRALPTGLSLASSGIISGDVGFPGNLSVTFAALKRHVGYGE